MAGGVEGAPSASIDSSLSSEGLKELPTLNKRGKKNVSVGLRRVLILC